VTEDIAGGVTLSSGERAFAGLLEACHLQVPHLIADTVAEHAAPLGVLRCVIYLADLRQEVLSPLPGVHSEGREPLGIDGTLAGLAYRVCKVFDTKDEDGRTQVWLPLLDGAERLGVMDLLVPELDEATSARCRMLATLTTLIIISKRAYSDTFAATRRLEPVELAAEMEWAFMPPLTFATEQVVVSGLLEPAYEVGGDAFDYALLDDTLHASMFDAVGHDLQSGLTSSVAMAACRNSRRAGQNLQDMTEMIDRTLAERFNDRFATAILLHLHLPTGVLRWINCGHPPPLLIRDGRVVKILESGLPRRPPLGLGPVFDFQGPGPENHEQLQPGDRLLLYTDGIVEARAPDGTFFGIDRLTDFILRHTAENMPIPEALRRLMRGILEHHNDRLTDDATILLIQWAPLEAGRSLLP
jgi:hypothetical protein